MARREKYSFIRDFGGYTNFTILCSWGFTLVLLVSVLFWIALQSPSQKVYTVRLREICEGNLDVSTRNERCLMLFVKDIRDILAKGKNK